MYLTISFVKLKAKHWWELQFTVNQHIVRILLILTPSRTKETIIPFGLLAISNVILKSGHEPKILDLPRIDEGMLENVNRIVKEYSPQLIGFGGITPTYKNLKIVSKYLKM